MTDVTDEMVEAALEVLKRHDLSMGWRLGEAELAEAISAALAARPRIDGDAIDAFLDEWNDGTHWSAGQSEAYIAQMRERASRTLAHADAARGHAMVRWRKMDSAPLNGDEVDLWVKNRRVADCHYHCGEWLQWRCDADDEPGWKRIHGAVAWAEMPTPPPWAETSPPVASTQAEASSGAQSTGDVREAPMAEPAPVFTKEMRTLINMIARRLPRNGWSRSETMEYRDAFTAAFPDPTA